MNPREDINSVAEEWHIPLAEDTTLREAMKEMEPFALAQDDVPLIIKLLENPKYDIGLFAGYVNLFTHDCVHILLGRGLAVKDEAFVIGYTMGSTKRMMRWRRNLFMFCAKYLYPEGYKFREDERFVFNAGVALGSKCPSDISKMDFKYYLDSSIKNVRELLGVDENTLTSYYELEKSLFRES